MRSANKKTNKQAKQTFIFLLCLILICSVCVATDIVLFPMIKSASAQIVKSKATMIINEAVFSVLESKELEYNDLITLEKSENGRVTALTTKAQSMNALKSNVMSEIYIRMLAYSEDEILLPFGNVFNSSLLLGKGPDIKISMTQFGACNCDYRNVFESCGINQTNHRVMLDIEMTVCVIMPLRCVKEKIETSVCIADTVIVGEVPQAFTNVQNYSSSDEGATVADEVVDFGAHNYVN